MRKNYVWIGLAITLSIALFGLIKLRPQKKELMSLELRDMTPTEAAAYVKNKLQPLLQQSAEDPTYPVGISSRIAAMYNAIGKGEVLYEALLLHPLKPTMLAHVDYRPSAEKPVLMVFAQLIEARERWYRGHGWSEDDFRLEVSIMVAHEYVHIELQKEFGPISARANIGPSPLDAREEAAAWGITATEMFRPALNQRRRLHWRYVEETEFFEKFERDYHDPRWVARFKNYHQ